MTKRVGGGSPRRRSSWTKHTSYPTLQNEEQLHIPAEISSGTRANIRCAEKRLDESRNRLNSMQRKSLGHLDSQRKLLEKSMLAYSEKMKDIASSRANELFREIQTRNSSRDDTRVKSPTHSVKSNRSLPAKLVAKRPIDDHYRKLKGFHQVNIYSPIEERSKESSPVPRSRSAPRHFVRSSTFCQSGHSPDTETPESKYSNRNSITCITRIKVETDHTDSDVHGKKKVYPRVATGSIPWLKNDANDSAYSSASEELEYSDTASEKSDNTCKSFQQKSNSKTENLLTVPVVHVRKQNRKPRRKRNTMDNNDKTTSHSHSHTKQALH
ncbi:uncharacterized protein LOC123565598 isoform X2 [Mercenaria mercenaria]|uniref:uncharacterized protein LOC123565598 isoform X2 n=1 Tax=Mercenaria mercenaria TaxID=6596 RepID=UPI00234F05B6|nr:uncharacterized protein LOC123565598 isoform X2 [Mercenaria mercenaria]